jgi:thiamine-monophosphate kinase
MPSEREIISSLRRRARRGSGLVLGIGDDGAVIRPEVGKDLLLCSDLLVEGIHFKRDWGEPGLLGRKALAVNLSDIAAMGGVPKYALVSVALPPGSSSEFVQRLFEGLFELGDESGVVVVGGDTSLSPGPLFIDVCVLGECSAGRAVTRGGAQPGDDIFVSGSLGGSALGLLLLDVESRTQSAESDKGTLRQLARSSVAEKVENEYARLGSGLSGEALRKHLIPEPRLKLGASLGENGIATAMIDISDGLSTDLGHILDESRCGAIIRAESVPIAACVRDSSLIAERGIQPLALALHGGEEYELLFTAKPTDRSRVAECSQAAGLSVTRIGEIVAGEGCLLEHNGRTEPLIPQGFEHVISG